MNADARMVAALEECRIMITYMLANDDAGGTAHMMDVLNSPHGGDVVPALVGIVTAILHEFARVVNDLQSEREITAEEIWQSASASLATYDGG